MNKEKKKEVQDVADEVCGTFTTQWGVGFAVETTASVKEDSHRKPRRARALDTRPPVNEPWKMGWLHKKGAVRKSWKKRWFVVFPNFTVAYYDKEVTWEQLSKAKPPKPKGRMSLVGYQIIGEESDAFGGREHGFEVRHSQKRCYFLVADNAEEREAWIQMFNRIVWYYPQNRHADKVIRKTFDHALRGTRQARGRWDAWTAWGNEEERLADLLRSEIDLTCMSELYATLKENPKAKTMANINKFVTGTVDASAKSTFNGCLKDATKMRDSLRSTIEENLEPLLKLEEDIAGRLDDLLLDLVNPAVESVVTPSMGQVLEHLGSIPGAFDLVYEAFDSFMAEFKDRVGDSPDNMEETFKDWQHEVRYHLGRMEPLYEHLSTLCDQLESISDVASAINPTTVMYEMRETTQKLLSNALHTFELDYATAAEEGSKDAAATADAVAEGVMKKMVYDGTFDILDAFSDLLVKVFVSPLLEQVAGPAADLMAPIDEMIVEPFDQVVQVSQVVVDYVTGKVAGLVEEAIAAEVAPAVQERRAALGLSDNIMRSVKTAAIERVKRVRREQGDEAEDHPIEGDDSDDDGGVDEEENFSESGDGEADDNGGEGGSGVKAGSDGDGDGDGDGAGGSDAAGTSVVQVEPEAAVAETTPAAADGEETADATPATTGEATEEAGGASTEEPDATPATSGEATGADDTTATDAAEPAGEPAADDGGDAEVTTTTTDESPAADATVEAGEPSAEEPATTDGEEPVAPDATADASNVTADADADAEGPVSDANSAAGDAEEPAADATGESGEPVAAGEEPATADATANVDEPTAADATADANDAAADAEEPATAGEEPVTADATPVADVTTDAEEPTAADATADANDAEEPIADANDATAEAEEPAAGTDANDETTGETTGAAGEDPATADTEPPAAVEAATTPSEDTATGTAAAAADESPATDESPAATEAPDAMATTAADGVDGDEVVVAEYNFAITQPAPETGFSVVVDPDQVIKFRSTHQYANGDTISVDIQVSCQPGESLESALEDLRASAAGAPEALAVLRDDPTEIPVKGGGAAVAGQILEVAILQAGMKMYSTLTFSQGRVYNMAYVTETKAFDHYIDLARACLASFHFLE